MAIQYLHTKLRVRDLDAAIHFYETVFGYTIRSRRPGPDDSEIAFLVFPDQAAELQLCQYPTPEPFDTPERLLHLAYRVDDMDAVLKSALSTGATLSKGPYTLPSGSLVAFIKDPNGYDLELVKKPS